MQTICPREELGLDEDDHSVDTHYAVVEANQEDDSFIDFTRSSRYFSFPVCVNSDSVQPKDHEGLEEDKVGKEHASDHVVVR